MRDGDRPGSGLFNSFNGLTNFIIFDITEQELFQRGSFTLQKFDLRSPKIQRFDNLLPNRALLIFYRFVI